jgi:4-hydroxymandelate oxidase
MDAYAQLSTVADYVDRARQLLPAETVAGMFGGARNPATAWTDARNAEGWRDLELRPHVLVDVSGRSTATEILGEPVSVPVVLSPVGSHVRSHPDGELASARAAGEAGVIMGLSTVSSYTIEEVAAAASGPLWFQLYVFRSRATSEELVRRAVAAGYRAIVVTVDNPGTSSEERRYRAVSQRAEHDVFPNLRGIPGAEGLGTERFHESLDDSLSWRDIEWLRGLSGLPLVIKGIQRADDARRCEECGVDAIVVSNHGGQALQGTRPTAETLAEVTASVGGRMEVLVDGGIRHGTDVLKALALGARGVLIGKPLYSGLAVGGSAGVRNVVGILQAELGAAMSLSGVTDVRAVPRDLVGHRLSPSQLMAGGATARLAATEMGV